MQTMFLCGFLFNICLFLCKNVAPVCDFVALTSLNGCKICFGTGLALLL